MAFAIIETGGKQHRAEPGKILTVERLSVAPEQSVSFDRVLLFSDGTSTQVGKPYLKNVTVQGKVLAEGKADKVVVFKYKSKINYRRTRGHRQPYSRVLVEQIQGGLQ